ncbi:hypothetical protein [Streptomyces sp. NPDC056707]|uniref:hypothetical protein n=1 Tax=Streptomyces sp. NPDC056707 TaxID=3345919 RepID=UPI0036BFCAD0
MSRSSYDKRPPNLGLLAMVMVYLVLGLAGLFVTLAMTADHHDGRSLPRCPAVAPKGGVPAGTRRRIGRLSG